MAFQRLILALTLLIVARVVTIVSPITALKEGGDRAFTSQQQPEFATPNSAYPDLPNEDSQALPSSMPYQGDDHFPIQEGIEAEPQISQQPRSFASQTASNSRVSQACQNVRSAVVTVKAGREIGSGSIVSSTGLVVTNFHVVRRLQTQALSVIMQSGTRYTSQVIATDRPNDLALLQIQAQTSFQSIPLSASGYPQLGQAVCAIGSPYGQAGVVTEGKVVNILPNGDLQSNVLLKPGNSGGPLINLAGEMVGVNKGVAKSARRGENRERISYATNALVTQAFIQQSRQSNSPSFNSLPMPPSFNQQPGSSPY